eukprot:TRINITY_DN9423_c0_g1_i5.p1 TRINITY_DN9423_c0_g1~~TRINITY_DN9423_c0_g1_i5.p1  ORF type:complete len:160 (-),score=4.61 TRINITY_DN9423_c0_g1_i5:64-498(-)
MSKVYCIFLLVTVLFVSTDGLFWGLFRNNLGAFNRRKHQFLFGNGGNRRQGDGVTNNQITNNQITNPAINEVATSNDQCKRDRDCSGRRRKCVSGRCSTETTCRGNKDCKGSERCVDFQCTRRYCLRNNDCSDGKRCTDYKCRF